MRIILLGTGTPIPDPNRKQSALLVELSGKKLLFDAGSGVISMAMLDIQPQHIDGVYITHHHYDHISGLGEFLLTAWNNGRETPLNVYGPPGTAEIVSTLLEKVYLRDIEFTLFTEKDTVDIRTLVRVTEVTSGWVQETSKWTIRAEYVDHGNSLGLSLEQWPCLGYRIEAEEKVIALSGDAVDCKSLDQLAHNADVLVQCCYRAESEINTPALERQARHVIASSGQVGKIAARNKVKKLVLTHIRPKSKTLMLSLVEDVREDYDGELVVGEDLMVIDV